MINQTKDTSANEWRFDEGCEKSPSAVILAFFSGTSSLRNKIHTLHDVQLTSGVHLDTVKALNRNINNRQIHPSICVMFVVASQLIWVL